MINEPDPQLLTISPVLLQNRLRFLGVLADPSQPPGLTVNVVTFVTGMIPRSPFADVTESVTRNFPTSASLSQCCRSELFDVTSKRWTIARTRMF